jgi:hypothetical protein
MCVVLQNFFLHPPKSTGHHSWLKRSLGQNALWSTFQTCPLSLLLLLSNVFGVNLVQKHSHIWPENITDVKASVRELRGKCKEHCQGQVSHPWRRPW